MNFLAGYKTFIIGALMLIGGVAAAVLIPETTIKGLGVLCAVQGAGMITLRLGIGDKVDEAKLVDAIVAKCGGMLSKKAPSAGSAGSPQASSGQAEKK